MTRHLTRTIAGLTVALFTAAACGDKDKDATVATTDSAAAMGTSAGTLASDDVDVESLDLGRTVGTDGKIADKTDEFRPTDAIVAVVETDDNAAGKELIARWTYGDNDQLVEEQRQTIAAGNDVRTTFKLTKPTAWPTGKYHVRIIANGKERKSEEFSVK
jgi:hypothetical protein